jgi:hypothetical protein
MTYLRELGCAVRTGFLLQYLGDADLRSTIQAATNKSESFNDFVQWLAFGGGGLIAENDRAEQREVSKYNQLLANCLIFHSAWTMARVLHRLRAESAWPVAGPSTKWPQTAGIVAGPLSEPLTGHRGLRTDPSAADRTGAPRVGLVHFQAASWARER